MVLRRVRLGDRALARYLLPASTTTSPLRVREVAAAGEALDVMRAARQDGAAFDLVLVATYMLGEEATRDFAKAVRSDPGLAGCRLVALGSPGVRGVAQELHSQGYAGYLAEPLGASQLEDLCCAVLRADDQVLRGQLLTRYSSVKHHQPEGRPTRRVLLVPSSP